MFKKMIIVSLVFMLCLTGCSFKRKKNTENTENDKRNAAQDAAYALRQAVDHYYVQALVINFYGFIDDVVFTCDGNSCKAPEGIRYLELDRDDYLEIHGNVPTEGTITITTDGTKTFSGIKYGSYICTDESLNGNSKIVCDLEKHLK